MHTTSRFVLVAGAALALFTAPAGAQGASVMADLLTDVGQVERKLVALARAIPADKYDWRAGDARSVRQVIMHIASDNYFIPVGTGVTAPAATGITGDYKTVTTYENRKVSADEAVKELETSFAFLKKVMQEVPAASLGTKQKLFGMEMTGQALWIMATTHLHEHLGQMIAYARSNGVVPPWSR